MKESHRKVSPSLVISCVALFASLGGVSYGVATNSIDSREVKNNSLRSKDVRNGTIVGKDVKANALGGGRVKESSLGKVPSATKADTAANAANATNLGGSAAASYAKGLNVLPVPGGPVIIVPNSTSPKNTTRECPAGQRLVSGGYNVGGDGRDNVTVYEDRVSPDGRSYIVGATEIEGGTGDTWTLTTRIVCANAN